MKRRASKWFEVPVRGRAYTARVYANLGDIHGDCTHATAAIRVERDDPHVMRETALHELLHALMAECGAHTILKKRLKCDLKTWDAFEEDLIEALTPAALRMLRALGLRFPRVPRTRARGRK